MQDFLFNFIAAARLPVIFRETGLSPTFIGKIHIYRRETADIFF